MNYQKKMTFFLDELHIFVWKILLFDKHRIQFLNPNSKFEGCGAIQDVSF